MTKYTCLKCNYIRETKDYVVLERKCPKCKIFMKASSFETPNIETKVRKKIGNNIWEFHKYDSDPFPSKPHGHNEKGEKLDINTGIVYDKNKNGVRRLSKNHLQEIIKFLSDKKFLDCVNFYS